MKIHIFSHNSSMIHEKVLLKYIKQTYSGLKTSVRPSKEQVDQPGNDSVRPCTVSIVSPHQHSRLLCLLILHDWLYLEQWCSFTNRNGLYQFTLRQTEIPNTNQRHKRTCMVWRRSVWDPVSGGEEGRKKKTRVSETVDVPHVRVAGSTFSLNLTVSVWKGRVFSPWPHGFSPCLWR